MSVFGAYSRYYNLLYKDKDYAREADYVQGLIAKYRPDAKTVLDLGCGTGRHDILLAAKGYSVTGVDLSEEMLSVARTNASKATLGQGRISFSLGDVRAVRLDLSFDAVLLLFHVMSYQTTNDDLQAAFATVKKHLGPQGICIFDCWYGPAVLSARPEVRVKRMEDPDSLIVRTCEPVLHPNDNCVDVNYEVLVIDKKSEKVEKINERHRMRYLFMPEIDDLIRRSGMTKLFNCEWMTGRAPGTDTWGVCVGFTNQ